MKFEEGQRYSFRPKHTEETKLKISNALYKGGSSTTWHKVAIKVMEEKIGRKLNKGETVHHLDHNPENNESDNLYLFESRGKHIQYHHFLINLVKKFLGMYKTQKEHQKEWYLENRGRILSKYKTHRGAYNVG